MVDDIINDYVHNHIGTMDLCEKYGLKRWKVQKILKENNVKLRKKTPITKVNHDFFSNYNSNNVYWAGFILADGYVRDNNRNTLIIKLQKNDINHLYKFKKDIGYMGNVKVSETYCYISISSDKIIKDLSKNFEINNKKSLICYISEKIPKDLLKDYIRGYFDGDGCITYTSTDTMSFVGTYNTLNFIRYYFRKTINLTLRSKEIPTINQNKNVWSIMYYGKSSYKCLSHLYENSTTYLDRKFEKYEKIKNKYENKNLYLHTE